jgi:hypothetical protein
MSAALTMRYDVVFGREAKGRKVLAVTPAAPPPVVPAGRVPRVARLMALALRFEGLVASCAADDFAELARLGYVTRARITQIMNLLHLAPDIQEELLFLPRVMTGRDPVGERDLRPIAAEVDWGRQRARWQVLVRDAAGAAQ